MTISSNCQRRRVTERNILCALYFPFLVVTAIPVSLSAQARAQTEIKLRAIADGVLKDATFGFIDAQKNRHYTSPGDAPSDALLRLESRYNDWRYWNGVLNIAMVKLGEALDDSAYKKFSDKTIGYCFDNYRFFKEKYKGEEKWNYPFGQLFTMEELDDCGAMGASLIEVYHLDKQIRYKDYISLAANHIERVQSRLNDSTLVRSFPRKWTLWADDLYMGVSFLCRMGELSGDIRYFDDAARQVVNFQKYLFDESAGLMHHCWYADSGRRGVAFWGRANGWAMLAQADLLDRLPVTHPQRDTLLALLRRDISGIACYQAKDGLWHQLLDKPDSYEETSCSAMFTYVIARGIMRGFIDTSFAPVARLGWEGVMTRIRSDGQIEGVCTGTGIGDDLEFYYKRPTPLNDEHGIGAVLLAGVEVLQLSKGK